MRELLWPVYTYNFINRRIMRKIDNMNFGIFFQQGLYMSFEQFDKLDCTDACIMACILDFAGSDRCESTVRNGQIYYWISSSVILRDLPMCRIKTKSGIKRRLNKLEEAGLIEPYEDNQSVGRSYYKLTKECEKIKYAKAKVRVSNPHNPCANSQDPLCELAQPPYASSHNDYNNNNYNNNSTIYEEEAESKKVDIISELVEVYNSLGAPFKKVTKITKGRRQKANERLKEIGSKEKFIQLIKKMDKCSFLKGNNQRGWLADFDFLIQNSEKWVKLHEGTYDDVEPKERKGKLEQYHNDPELDDFDVNEKIAEYNRTHEDKIPL